MRAARALFAALALALAVVAPVSADPPNSITVADGSFAGTAAITGFETNVDRPWALGECFANETTVTTAADGELVFAQYVALYDHPQQGDSFTLGPTPLWQGGGADCTATLGYWHLQTGDFRPKATTTFSASP